MNIISKLVLTVLLGILTCSIVGSQYDEIARDGERFIQSAERQSEPGGL